MVYSQVLTFIAIAAILTITPGADTMLVVRNVLARGQRAGFLTTIGICSGLFFHATLSALGLSIILVRSATVFEVVKIVGACYLIFLGGRSLWQALHAHVGTTPGIKRAIHKAYSPPDCVPFSASPLSSPDIQKAGKWRSVREGFLSNVLNPKVAVFYLAFLPQFINPGDFVLGKSLLLAGIHFVLGIVWLSLVTIFLGRMRALLIRPAVQRGLEAVTGAILIGFGVRLVLERRCDRGTIA